MRLVYSVTCHPGRPGAHWQWWSTNNGMRIHFIQDFFSEQDARDWKRAIDKKD